MSRHVPHWIVHSIHLFIMSQTRKNLTFYISTQGIYHQFYAWCFFHHDHIDCTCSHMITFNATRIFFVCWYTKLLFGNMVGTTKSDKIPNILQVKFIASIVVAICARNKEVLLILNLSIKYVTHKYDIISRINWTYNYVVLTVRNNCTVPIYCVCPILGYRLFNVSSSHAGWYTKDN